MARLFDLLPVVAQCEIEWNTNYNPILLPDKHMNTEGVALVVISYLVTLEKDTIVPVLRVPLFKVPGR
jgi:hypothetical protein